MNESPGFAVFFFPPALEALGDAIKPYLQDSPAGPHLVCKEIDTGGALLEMTLEGMTGDGRAVQLELMVPGSMVRMIVSSQSDGSFGFGPRVAAAPVPALPPVGPTAEPTQARPEALPVGGAQATPAAGPAAAPAAAPADETAKPAP
jgi:hypothetical protein